MAVELKALVDKEQNRVVFAESRSDFVEALFGFLTIPLATIMKHAHNRSRTEGLLSCMHNLYESVGNLDVNIFKNEACKEMLLNPRNASESFCKNLNMKDLYAPGADYYLSCGYLSSCKSLSRYRHARCTSGHSMACERHLTATSNSSSSISTQKKKSSSSSSPSPSQDHLGGVFVKRNTRFVISDDLQVMSLCDGTRFSFLSKLGVLTNWSAMEERIFNVQPEEVLDILLCSLVSTTPLTETLLKAKPVVPAHRPYQSENGGVKMKDTNQEGNVAVKLIVSKTKKSVCFAEANVEFVNLLFSFLGAPLGHVLRQNYERSLNGCIGQLYKSVHELDEQCFISSSHKEMLVSPMVAPGLGYKTDLLGIKEASYPEYYYTPSSSVLATSIVPSFPPGTVPVRVLDPKSQYNDGEHGEAGFLSREEAMSTVTDSLIIRPISPMLSLSILNELKVPFSDIEEQIVHVGKGEAMLLLLHASLASESALTNAFIH